MFRLLRYWSSTGKEAEAEEEHGNSVKIEIPSITPVLHAFLDFFQIIIVSFQHVPHFGVGIGPK